MTDEIIQVVTTTADKQDAESLAQALLAKRLAGCVQISGPIESRYWWNGRIETATEWNCTIKTLRSLYASVEAALLDLHPYDQPEVMATAVTNVSAGYSRWLREQLQPEPLPGDAKASETTGQATPPAAVTPAQAAELAPAAGPAAGSQSNVPQAAPYPADDASKAPAQPETPAKGEKRPPRKKSPGGSR